MKESIYIEESSRGISQKTWDAMNESDRAIYIEEHPTSRYAKVSPEIKYTNPDDTLPSQIKSVEKHTTLREELDQFYCSEHYYKLGCLFPNVVLTDGVKYYIDKGDALWSITDSLAYILYTPKIARLGFHTIRVQSHDGKAVISIEDGNDKVLKTFKYSHTDLEEGDYDFFLIRDAVRITLLLPNEY